MAERGGIFHFRHNGAHGYDDGALMNCINSRSIAYGGWGSISSSSVCLSEKSFEEVPLNWLNMELMTVDGDVDSRVPSIWRRSSRTLCSVCLLCVSISFGHCVKILFVFVSILFLSFCPQILREAKKFQLWWRSRMKRNPITTTRPFVSPSTAFITSTISETQYKLSRLFSEDFCSVPLASTDGEVCFCSAAAFSAFVAWRKLLLCCPSSNVISCLLDGFVPFLAVAFSTNKLNERLLSGNFLLEKII